MVGLRQPFSYPEKRAPRDELNQIWRKLLSRGVTIAASSDAGLTDMLYEDYVLIPEMMVSELGLAPMEAILDCTKNEAKALGLKVKIGPIEVGKTTD